MTLNNFLSSIQIEDHNSEAKYPDGSGGKDRYTLLVQCDGHGRLMSAQVQKAKVFRGMMCVQVNGTEGEKANVKPKKSKTKKKPKKS